MDQFAVEAIDIRMMRRCIELSRIATTQGEFPFAALICSKDGTVLAEATNRVARDRDVTRHAELLAVSEAQKVLGQAGLAECTIYSNLEPCVMCSFPIRESRIGRVVFGIRSPMMGGFSRWNVLGDRVMSKHMPAIFQRGSRNRRRAARGGGRESVDGLEPGDLGDHHYPRLLRRRSLPFAPRSLVGSASCPVQVMGTEDLPQPGAAGVPASISARQRARFSPSASASAAVRALAPPSIARAAGMRPASAGRMMRVSIAK